MARPKYQRQIDDAVDRVVDSGIDALFERASDFFQRGVDNQRRAMAEIPAEVRRSAYRCSGCHNMFPFEKCAMISAVGDGFCACKPCFSFMWHAGDEKMKLLKEATKGAARGAAENRRQASSPGPSAPTPRKPWEVLGISSDASIDELKKAYRKLAAANHPDIIPPGAPSEEREQARLRFEEVTRAYTVMMKVRSAAT